jgi:tRNA (adenine57-N1/adenine58-N1)-methyltransferase catalytic subunit
MNDIPDPTHTQPGDLAQLVSPSNKTFTVRLVPGGQLQTHRGVLEFDDLIGLPWGSEIYSHKGSPFFLLQPALGDLLREMKRATQIMYPKDIGYVLVAMGIGPGTNVLEAGTGSGALTTALAWAVGPQGHVTSYEIRPDTQRLAQKNLERLGLDDRVTFKLKDISEGFDETGVDALFLDVQNSYDYIRQAREALKSGGFFGSILPTTNQVSRLLVALYQYDFAFVDVCEIILRFYKAVPERLRPTDRMVAHTGFLIFGRPMLPSRNRSSVQEVSSNSIQDEAGLREGPESEIFE